ncbi:putative MFS transporter [Patellaria atrata CBS 101060]|uniref:MFS transporter n=1 Tax=Patellaria atrata CBS 101060 TaxID=1346257 RepID=A0A9P4VLY9_9PEZI|nr:putative MFS transporter [Patellaria atrata CBS 101060]
MVESNLGSMSRETTPSASNQDMKADASYQEVNHVSTARDAAEPGQYGTDKYGRPLVEIDPAAESRLCRKIDLYVIPTVSLLYLFCFLDRANIGNARIAGMDKDLNFKGYDYNQILSCFYISYVIFEIPCTLACKWMGPGWFIPATSLGFGIASIGTAFVHSVPAICVVRFILGIFEAGMLPGIAYYLSRWYRRSELSFRLALYIVMAPLAGAFGGLLASAILKLSHFGSLTEWKMIFAIEGIITCGLALVSFLTLTDRPETAMWLSQDEKDLAIARIKSERVGASEVLDKIDTKKTMLGIFNPVTLATSFIFLLDNITVQGLAFFAPTIVRTIYPKNSIISVQLHTVPPYVVGAFFTLLFPFLSWRLDKRNIFFIISAPLMMAGYIMFLASENSSVRYGATFLIASGATAFGALCNAQVSANVVSDTARSAAIGTNVMFGNIGGLISTWSFLPFDGPDFPIGNGLNLATSSTILLCSIALLWWMTRNNKHRDGKNIDKELEGLDQRRIEELDWKHPAFKWKP